VFNWGFKPDLKAPSHEVDEDEDSGLPQQCRGFMPEEPLKGGRSEPAHHEGWMISGQETVFCWVPVP